MVVGTFTLARKATGKDGVWYHDSGELTDDMSAADALGGTSTPINTNQSALLYVVKVLSAASTWISRTISLVAVLCFV